MALSRHVEGTAPFRFLNQKYCTIFFPAAPAAIYKSKEVTSWGQSRLEILKEAVPGG